ncbi:Peptidyl-prolyl cis-trans isomerase [Granulibacter bethesdensis]|uniref:Parvulin-like PPIase n=2 Tax=Granulibacter bethesdensis TaxID=364410 RepID=Q0BQ08_GRABC|nr:Peptidyl-prolyl cis-trans isomerase [Granulibacter bethesdensis CGDNIH1]AHJ67936.1 Peptidyl-prolyl cis-trans isomerase [Granulibacter bethesdensis]APH52970.1 Peptidyl-prolyl cis-trans isomerase [Granulibacter bethesdensis]APH65658.1 Peptidyl-prolyl cis-trans isomerase [Granulibacter bethesdensis]
MASGLSRRAAAGYQRYQDQDRTLTLMAVDRFRALLLAGLALSSAQPALAASHGGSAAGKAKAPASSPDETSIVAVVNGDVISKGDVDARRRLFAMSTGLPMSKEVLDRLTPQVLRQLVDEKLRLQEIQRRGIVITDSDIAHSIQGMEQRNGMQPDALRHKLAADGVSMRTLIDQIRVQLGWTRVLRQQLGERVRISDKEIQDEEELLASQKGQTEYRVSEIFIPVDDPSRAQAAHDFADTVIQQLRSGAPFPVVAAQFSQSQTALEGGDLGWVQPNQLDPQVVSVLKEMPPGAISNPIDVAGGIEIVALRGKRIIGNDQGTALSIRQVFYPFTTPLNPAAPTDQQRKTLEHAKAAAAAMHDCAAVEAASKAMGGSRPSDPGELRLESINPPQFRALLASLPVGQPSQPIVSQDGIAIMMVCSRTQKNFGLPGKEDISNQILGERVETASRQLQRELRRRALIDMRGHD